MSPPICHGTALRWPHQRHPSSGASNAPDRRDFFRSKKEWVVAFCIGFDTDLSSLQMSSLYTFHFFDLLSSWKRKQHKSASIPFRIRCFNPSLEYWTVHIIYNHATLEGWKGKTGKNHWTEKFYAAYASLSDLHVTITEPLHPYSSICKTIANIFKQQIKHLWTSGKSIEKEKISNGIWKKKKKTRWNPRTRMPTRMLRTDKIFICHIFQRTHLWDTLSWHTEVTLL